MLRRTLLVCVLTTPWSAALAQGGGLTVPDHPRDPIVMQLKEPLGQRDPSNVLQVFVGRTDACCDGKTPIVGHYRVVGRRLEFDPTFDFVFGQSYAIQSRDMASGDAIELTEFELHDDDRSFLSQVTEIYPSGPEIPENTLRFYVHFAAPMQPHASADFIKLMDSSGTPDTAAFMSFKQELWNADRTRLTVLMDPGRIKRGVVQNRALGPALREGASYSLVIEEGWPSANGGQKAPRYAHPYTVTSALRTLPDIQLWQFDTPGLGTLEPLRITFDRPFDHQLLQSSIRVSDEGGQLVSGTISVSDHEKNWAFRPDQPWASKSLQVIVDARLEDTAGNNFRDLLDHVQTENAQTPSLLTHTLHLKSLPE